LSLESPAQLREAILRRHEATGLQLRVAGEAFRDVLLVRGKLRDILPEKLELARTLGFSDLFASAEICQLTQTMVVHQDTSDLISWGINWTLDPPLLLNHNDDRGGLFLTPPSSGGLCDGVMTTPSASPLLRRWSEKLYVSGIPAVVAQSLWWFAFQQVVVTKIPASPVARVSSDEKSTPRNGNAASGTEVPHRRVLSCVANCDNCLIYFNDEGEWLSLVIQLFYIETDCQAADMVAKNIRTANGITVASMKLLPHLQDKVEAMFASRRNWARAVLGVMLSGFSL